MPRMWSTGVLLCVSMAATYGIAVGQVGVGKDEIFTGGARDTDDPGTIIGHEVRTGVSREVYRPARGHVFAFAVSPSGELLAVLDRIFDVGVSPRDATVQLPGVGLVREWRGLRILTSRGVQIGAEIPLVRRFAWSPDSRGIVYVTGRYQGLYREDAEPSVWIWGVTDDRPRKIRDGSHQVAWPRFDGNIYLWEMIEGIASQVLKVNPATASIEQTTHRSIYFSPTGDYYYGPASFGPQENVYARAMDFPLKNTSRVLSSFNGFRPVAWAPDADLLLVEASRGPGRAAEQVMVIYDPKADTSLDVPSTVVGWGPTSHGLVTVSDDSVRLITLSDFGSFR